MILFYLLLGYLLFRFVVGFLVPVFRTTKHMKDQFSQMNQPKRPAADSGKTSAGPSFSSGTSSSPKHPDASQVGEYIDFEEIKP